MTEDSKCFNCELCYYISKKKFNLSRHIMRNHIVLNVSPTAQKAMPNPQKSNA